MAASLISVPQVSDSRVDTNDYVDFSPPRILAVRKSLPSHNGCGPDLLPSELLKASGMFGASAIADVCGRMQLEEKWLLQWTGGRQNDLFRGKGNVQNCDASRGLLLADHMSKIPATISKRECDPHYCAHTHSCVSVGCCTRPRSRHGSLHKRLQSRCQLLLCLWTLRKLLTVPSVNL